MLLIKTIIVIVIFIIIISVLSYVRIYITYYPMPVKKKKYHNFFTKIKQMTMATHLIDYVDVITSDNTKLDTIHIKNIDNDFCIMIFNDGHRNFSTLFEIIKYLYNYASIIIFDYRAHGESTGNIMDLNESLIISDCMQIWKYTIYILGYVPNNIAFFGTALGCSIATSLSSNISLNYDPKFYPRALILNSPISSFSNLVSDLVMDYLPAFCRRKNIHKIINIISDIFYNQYNTCYNIKFMNHYTKIIITHSKNDNIIRYKHGLELYETSKKNHPNVTFIELTGTHNNIGIPINYIYYLSKIFS